MTHLWKTLGVTTALIVFTAFSATAQESGDNGTGLNLGETIVDGRAIGEEYIKETFGDWAHRCITTDGDDPCNSYQLLMDGEGNAVAEISLVPLTNGGQAVAGGTIVTPLETLLTRQITLQVDDGPGRRYPFTFCTRTGCVSRVGFTQADIDAMKAGAEARLSIFPAGSPEQPVTLSVSLTGFTAAYDALETR